MAAQDIPRSLGRAARCAQTGAIDDLFSATVTPLKVSFWLMPFHWTALVLGLGGDEAEALRYEWQLIADGQRDLLGRPCLCSTIADFPQALMGGRGGAHDSLATLCGLKADLVRAADTLPLPWRATERIFSEQRRDGVYQARMTYFRHGSLIRRRDRDPEPRDEAGRYVSRQYCLAAIAWQLGWRGTCRWPRPLQLVEARALQLAA